MNFARIKKIILLFFICLASVNLAFGRDNCAEIFLDNTGLAAASAVSVYSAETSSDGLPLKMGSIQTRLAELSAKHVLLGQQDPRLTARNLRGLCASACGINTLIAFFDWHGVYKNIIKDKPDFYLEKLVQHVWGNFNETEKNGMTLDHLESGLREVVGLVTARKNDFGSHILYFNTTHFGENFFLSETPWLQLLKVTVGSSQHVIVMLGMDSVKKKIMFFEPNFPNVVRTVNYVPTRRNGRDTINLHWDGIFGDENPNGDVLGVLRIWLNSSVHSTQEIRFVRPQFFRCA